MRIIAAPLLLASLAMGGNAVFAQEEVTTGEEEEVTQVDELTEEEKMNLALAAIAKNGIGMKANQRKGIVVPGTGWTATVTADGSGFLKVEGLKGVSTVFVTPARNGNP